MGRDVLQYSHCTCDTALDRCWARGWARRGCRARRACAGSASGRQGERRRARGERRRQTRRARWTALQRRAGRPRQGAAGRGARRLALGCALGLFSIQIDSVLFLSRFLDIVREPGS